VRPAAAACPSVPLHHPFPRPLPRSSRRSGCNEGTYLLRFSTNTMTLVLTILIGNDARHFRIDETDEGLFTFDFITEGRTINELLAKASPALPTRPPPPPLLPPCRTLPRSCCPRCASPASWTKPTCRCGPCGPAQPLSMRIWNARYSPSVRACVAPPLHPLRACCEVLRA
jgi:hypothetical protein